MTTKTNNYQKTNNDQNDKYDQKTNNDQKDKR